ncbi:MAG: hypothetical protein AAFN77_23370 [Planctomycetota bacterium]
MIGGKGARPQLSPKRLKNGHWALFLELHCSMFEKHHTLRAPSLLPAILNNYLAMSSFDESSHHPMETAAVVIKRNIDRSENRCIET